MRTLIIAAICVFLPLSVYGANLKLGYIDLKQVISKSDPGKQAMNELKKKFDGMKKDLDKQKKDIDNLQSSLQKQSLVLSQEAKMDKELEFKRKVRDFQDLYQSYQRRMKQDEQRLSEPILKELVDIIKEYGKKNKFTAIFDSNNSGMLYADDSIDLSNAIIVELNRVWRKKGK